MCIHIPCILFFLPGVDHGSRGVRFSYDAGQLYQALDLDGGGELTLEELDPRADELFAAGPQTCSSISVVVQGGGFSSHAPRSPESSVNIGGSPSTVYGISLIGLLLAGHPAVLDIWP